MVSTGTASATGAASTTCATGTAAAAGTELKSDLHCSQKSAPSPLSNPQNGHFTMTRCTSEGISQDCCWYYLQHSPLDPRRGREPTITNSPPAFPPPCGRNLRGPTASSWKRGRQH